MLKACSKGSYSYILIFNAQNNQHVNITIDVPVSGINACNAFMCIDLQNYKYLEGQ